jgi:lambda family phage tail tape measure protein
MPRGQAERRVGVRLAVIDGKRAEGEMRNFGETGERSLNRIAYAARPASRELQAVNAVAREFRGLLAGIGVGLLARETIQAADSWTRYRNQLAAAGVAQSDLNAVMDDARAIARRSRSDLEGTATLYARLLNSTRELGVSQREVGRATEIVNKALVAGGAAASERASTILQLSQAIASGRLQGEELRALREAAPLLLRAIAAEFGVTVGELKRLGEEGQLTTDRLVEAILNGGDAIEAQFSQTKATVADARAAFVTEFTAMAGQFNQSIGITDGLAAAITGAADSLKYADEVAVVLAATIAGQLIGRALVPLARATIAARNALLGMAAADALVSARLAGTIIAVRSLASAGAALSAALAFFGGPWVVGITLAAAGIAALAVAARNARDPVQELIDAGDDLTQALEDTDEYLRRAAASSEEFGDRAAAALERLRDALPEEVIEFFERLRTLQAEGGEALQTRAEAIRSVVAEQRAEEERLAELIAVRDRFNVSQVDLQRFSEVPIVSGGPLDRRGEQLNQEIEEARRNIEAHERRVEALRGAPDDAFLRPRDPRVIAELTSELEKLQEAARPTEENIRLLREELATLESGRQNEETGIRAAILRVRIEALEKPARDALAADQQKTADLIENLTGELGRVGDEQAQFIARVLERLPDSATPEQRLDVEDLARELFAANQREEIQTREARRVQETDAAMLERVVLQIDELLGRAESPLSADRRDILALAQDLGRTVVALQDILATDISEAERRRRVEAMANELRFDPVRQSESRRELADQAERFLAGDPDARLQLERTLRGVADLKASAEASAGRLDAIINEEELRVRRAVLEASSDPIVGAIRGLEELRDTAGDVADVVEGGFISAFQNADQAVGDFVRRGKISIRELVISIIADLAQLSARAFILGPLAGGLGNAIGGRFGAAIAGAYGNAGVPAPVQHGGGMAGVGPVRHIPASAFLGAPRLHGGGWLGVDEIPTILRRGERVLNPAEARAYGQQPPPVNVHFHGVTDLPSFRASRTQITSDIARAVAFGARGM